MKASSVFGFSKVADKKFENVEKLYKAGAKVDVKIDYGCDADIIARYHEKGRPEMKKVIRFDVESRKEAISHITSIERDMSAIYLYFAPNQELPVYWTGQSENFRYLFS